MAKVKPTFFVHPATHNIRNERNCKQWHTIVRRDYPERRKRQPGKPLLPERLKCSLSITAYWSYIIKIV